MTIVAICAAIVRSRLFATTPDVAAWGVTFDLTITIPAIYWLVVVRSGRARAATIAPVFVAGAAIAALVVPHDQQHFLHQLRLVAAPLDVITVGLVLQRLIGHRQSGSGDAETRIRSAARAAFGESTLAEIVASELSILYYALFCWRRQPVVTADAQVITVHRNSGWGSIAACIVVLLTFESLGMHLAVSLWSTKAAWIVTALDLYGILWVLGDYHALRLRSTTVTRDSLEVRHGLRWSASIPLDNIASIDRVRSEAEWKRKQTLKVALVDEPQFIVRLCTPVASRGVAGLRRTIDSVAFRPDDVAAFEQALRPL